MLLKAITVINVLLSMAVSLILLLINYFTDSGHLNSPLSVITYMYEPSFSTLKKDRIYLFFNIDNYTTYILIFARWIQVLHICAVQVSHKHTFFLNYSIFRMKMIIENIFLNFWSYIYMYLFLEISIIFTLSIF